MIEVVIKPFERWNGWRKKGIHVRLVLVPFRFQCSGGELGLRLEEIIKASLFCAGPLADRVHRGSAVAVFPPSNQPLGRFGVLSFPYLRLRKAFYPLGLSVYLYFHPFAPNSRARAAPTQQPLRG